VLSVWRTLGQVSHAQASAPRPAGVSHYLPDVPPPTSPRVSQASLTSPVCDDRPMIDRILALPWGWAFLFLWVSVMGRANGTYWIGRAVAAGTGRTRWPGC